jgi:predicted metal-dependent RNase
VSIAGCDQSAELIALVDDAASRGALPSGLEVFVDGGIVDGLQHYRDVGALPGTSAVIRVRPVRSVEQRQDAIDAARSAPCIVLATSAGAQYGPVVEWIDALGRDPKTIVMFAGGREEYLHVGAISQRAGQRIAPARRELHVSVDGEHRIIRLAKPPLRYWLSTLAGLPTLLDLADRIAPRIVIPVHGNAGAIPNLARELSARGHAVQCVEDGGAVAVPRRAVVPTHS